MGSHYTNKKRNKMIKTPTLEVGGYYLFESKSGARNCYFESEEEIRLFENLWIRYLGKYIETHKIHISIEAYHILLRIRTKKVIVGHYIKRCEKREREINVQFLKEPWRIISEQIRIFHSVYVKAVNKIRDREGVLVQSRYSKYYFEDIEEFEGYLKGMKGGLEIKGQRNQRYRVSDRWMVGVRWGFFRGVLWVEKHMNKAFQNYVVSKLIFSTKTLHSPPP